MPNSPWITIRDEKMHWRKEFVIDYLTEHELKEQAELYVRMKAARLLAEAQKEYADAWRCANLIPCPDGMEYVSTPPALRRERDLEANVIRYRVQFTIERKPKIRGLRADNVIIDDPYSDHDIKAKLEADLMTVMGGKQGEWVELEWGTLGVDPAKPNDDQSAFTDPAKWYLPEEAAKSCQLVSHEERKKLAEEHGLPAIDWHGNEWKSRIPDTPAEPKNYLPARVHEADIDPAKWKPST